LIATIAAATAVALRPKRRYGPALRMTEWPGCMGCRGCSILRPIGPYGFSTETEMPKMKTKSGVKKRFKITASGKIKHGVAGKRHRLISHNAKYIRQNRGTSVLSEADTPRVKLWAPYGLK
jgi:large subunit ribosomal protein L35